MFCIQLHLCFFTITALYLVLVPQECELKGMYTSCTHQIQTGGLAVRFCALPKASGGENEKKVQYILNYYSGVN